MNLPRTSRPLRAMARAGLALLAGLAATSMPLHAQSLFRYGFEPLQPAPEVRVLRDDRVATLEIDYDADDAWGQWWTMDGSGSDPAGFREWMRLRGLGRDEKFSRPGSGGPNSGGQR